MLSSAAGHGVTALDLVLRLENPWVCQTLSNLYQVLKVREKQFGSDLSQQQLGSSQQTRHFSSSSPIQCPSPSSATTMAAASSIPRQPRRKLDIQNIPMLGAFIPSVPGQGSCSSKTSEQTFSASHTMPSSQSTSNSEGTLRTGPVDASPKDQGMGWREMLARAREAQLVPEGPGILTDTFR